MNPIPDLCDQINQIMHKSVSQKKINHVYDFCMFMKVKDCFHNHQSMNVTLS